MHRTNTVSMFDDLRGNFDTPGKPPTLTMGREPTRQRSASSTTRWTSPNPAPNRQLNHEPTNWNELMMTRPTNRSRRVPELVFEPFRDDDRRIEFRGIEFHAGCDRALSVLDFAQVILADLEYDHVLPCDAEEASLAFLRDRLLSLAVDVEARRRWLTDGDGAEPVRLRAPW